MAKQKTLAELLRWAKEMELLIEFRKNYVYVTDGCREITGKTILEALRAAEKKWGKK